MVMTVVDPVVARASIVIGSDSAVLATLPQAAAGRPLVIDYFASQHRGVTVGDLTVGFPATSPNRATSRSSRSRASGCRSNGT
jgi:hypothetical protein